MTNMTPERLAEIEEVTTRWFNKTDLKESSREYFALVLELTAEVHRLEGELAKVTKGKNHLSMCVTTLAVNLQHHSIDDADSWEEWVDEVIKKEGWGRGGHPPVRHLEGRPDEEIPANEVLCSFKDCYASGYSGHESAGLCYVEGCNPRDPHCKAYRQLCTHCGGEGLEPAQQAEKE